VVIALKKFEHVVLEKKGKIATLVIDRPEKLNAMTSRTRKEIMESLDEVADDSSVRVLVLTGTGDRAFTTGQDISESVNFAADEAGPWVKEWDTLYNKILDLPVPVIARVNGYAVGAGFQVALLCDLRIASENAKVGMTEINIGIPCILGSYLICNVGGLTPAIELTLTGELIDAKRAAEMGLVNKVVPMKELDKTVQDLAQKLAEKPPIALKMQRRWLKWFKRELAEVSKRAQEIHTEVYASGEPAEYMAKFLERKKK
jgi:enoyl-CoA hydratase/carnithine racemase